MQISNLIETLSTFSFFGFAFLLYLLGNLYKKIAQTHNFKRTERNHESFLKYEDSWYYYVAWGGGLLWSAIYQTIFFNDIYNSIHSSDSVVSLIVLIFLYEIFLFLWLHYLYLKHDNYFKLARTAVVLGLICLLLIFIFIWVFFDDYQWYHFGVVLLLIPSIFELLCIVDSQTFRLKIIKTISNSSNLEIKKKREFSKHNNFT
jgi:hypothetical protein